MNKVKLRSNFLKFISLQIREDTDFNMSKNISIYILIRIHTT